MLREDAHEICVSVEQLMVMQEEPEESQSVNGEDEGEAGSFFGVPESRRECIGLATDGKRGIMGRYRAIGAVVGGAYVPCGWME